MDGPGFWALAVLAAVLVGLRKGGLPVVGMLAVPVLALAMSPVTAAGLLLPVYVLSDMFGLYAYRRAFDRRVLAILMPATTLGVALGWATASVVPERLVTRAGRADRRGLCAEAAVAAPSRDAGTAGGVAAGTFWGTVTGFTSFRQPCRRAALSGLCAAAGPGKDGLRRHDDDPVRLCQRDQADALLGAGAVVGWRT